MARGLLLLCGLLLAGLFYVGVYRTELHRDAGDTAPALHTATLDFEYAGCERVRSGPVCELKEDRVLHVWVPGNVTPTVETPKGPPQITERRRIDGGHRLALRLPEDAGHVELRVGSERGRLRVAESSRPQLIAEASALRGAGKWQAAQALLQEQVDSLPPAEASRGRALLARIKLSRGQIDAGLSALTTASNQAFHDGLLSDSAKDALAIAYTLTFKRRDYSAAQRWLQLTEERFSDLPEVRVLLEHYTGLLSREVGKNNDSLVRFKKAAQLAERLALTLDYEIAQQEVARTQYRLGRRQLALTTHQRLVDSASSEQPCVKLSRLLTLVWFQLRSHRSGQHATRTLQLVEAALPGCPTPSNVSHHQLNSVYHALALGQDEVAERRLAQLDQSPEQQSTRLKTWEALLRARLKKTQRHFDQALSLAKHARLIAAAGNHLELAHAALVLQAELHEQMGASQRSRQAYIEAEALVEQVVKAMPLGASQQLFSSQLERSAEGLMAHYLKLGQPRQALAVARRARRRRFASHWRHSKIEALSGDGLKQWHRAIADYRTQKGRLELQAKNDWKLPLDELRGLQRSREVMRQMAQNALSRAYSVLGSSPLDVLGSSPRAQPATDATQSHDLSLLITRVGGQWYAFSERGTQLAVHRLESISEDAPSSLWAKALSPVFRDLTDGIDPAPASIKPSIKRSNADNTNADQEHTDRAHTDTTRAGVLHVALHPSIAHLDVHSLEHDGRPLVDHLPISYVLDARPKVRETTPESEPHAFFSSVLIVADPTSELPKARSEATLVAQQVQAGSTALLLGTQATRRQVLEQWNSLELFHFAGHSNFHGTDGLLSHLKLANGEQLSVSDVLATGSAPKHVVLAGCEAAATRRGTQSGLGLSLAFLAAGSRTVVGPTRQVSDLLGRQFSRLLYQNLHNKTPAGWATAVQKASRQLRSQTPTADWSAFRSVSVN